MRVLLVERDTWAFANILPVFEDESVDCRHVSRLQDALVQIHEWEPDIILLEFARIHGKGFNEVITEVRGDTQALVVLFTRELLPETEVLLKRGIIDFGAELIRYRPGDGKIFLAKVTEKTHRNKTAA